MTRLLLPLSLILLFSCKGKETTHTVVLTEWAEQRDSAVSTDSFNTRVKRAYQQLKDSGIYFIAPGGGIQTDSSQGRYIPNFRLTDTSGYINRGRDTLHWPKHVIIKKKGKYYGTGFGYIRNEPSFHNTTLNNEQHFTIRYSTKSYAPLILSDSYGVMIRDSSGTVLAQRDTIGTWHIYDCSKALEETYKILFNKYKQ